MISLAGVFGTHPLDGMRPTYSLWPEDKDCCPIRVPYGDMIHDIPLPQYEILVSLKWLTRAQPSIPFY